MQRGTGSAAVIGGLAGLAGGLTEVVWIWVYATWTGGDAGEVARAVTDAVGFGGQSVSPAAGGIAIHMGLAVLLGLGLAFVLSSIGGLLSGIGVYATVIAALAIVWSVNFIFVLPLISPQFVQIVPYGVSFISKLLFGVAAALLFRSESTRLNSSHIQKSRMPSSA